MDDGIDDVLTRLMGNLLVLAYGVSWAVTTVWPNDGLKFLLITSTVLTLPYFGITFVVGLIGAAVVFAVLAALAVAFPPLAVIAILLGVMLNVAKFGGCLMNIPVIVAGGVLYWLLALPRKVGILISQRDVDLIPTIMIAVVAAAVGLSIILGVLRLFERFDYPRAAVAAMLLGFSWYVLIFVVSLIVPFVAHHTGLIDGSGGGGDQQN